MRRLASVGDYCSEAVVHLRQEVLPCEGVLTILFTATTGPVAAVAGRANSHAAYSPTSTPAVDVARQFWEKCRVDSCEFPVVLLRAVPVDDPFFRLAAMGSPFTNPSTLSSRRSADARPGTLPRPENPID